MNWPKISINVCTGQRHHLSCGQFSNSKKCKRIPKIAKLVEMSWYRMRMWGCTGLWTSYVQRARNFFKFLPQHTHTISWHLDKFCDFRNSFAFFRIKKPPAWKMVALPHAHVDRNFGSVHGFGLTLHSKTRISFFESFKSNIRCTRSSNLHFPKKFNKSK